MRRLLPTILLITTIALLSGCASYTAREAIPNIDIPLTDRLELPVTKHSLIVAERQAAEALVQEASAQETIVLLEEKIEELERTVAIYEQDDTILVLQGQIASRQEIIEGQRDTIARLDGEIAALEQARTLLSDQLSTALVDLQRHQATEAEQRELLDDQQQRIAGLDDETTALGEERALLSFQLLAAQAELERQESVESEQRALLDDREQRIAQLSDELAALDEEHTLLSLQLLAVQADLERQETVESEQRALLDDREQRIAQLNDEITALLDERQALSGQLAVVNAALDEQRRIEAAAEAERVQAEQRQLLAQQQEAERQERERQAELARIEWEREQARLIPPLSQLRPPHRFIISDVVKTVAKGSILKTLLLPLSDVPWKEHEMVDSVAQSIADLDDPVIFITGAMENVTALVRRVGANAILLDGGAIITPLEVLEVSKDSVQVRLNGEQTLRLSLANLVEYEVFSAFLNGGEGWKETQQRITGKRLEHLLQIVRQGSIVEPTIVAGSLYEPSHQDWSSFSPIAYRQVDYLWPLSAAMEDEQFLDVYRLTHFSAGTDSGNTIALGEIKERVDYLFSRKVLPLFSTILPIGGESAPQEGAVQRWGIAASLLIP